ITALETPLNRVIARVSGDSTDFRISAQVFTPRLQATPSPHAVADAYLAAAIARTLGGADDMKSPRAPGILDVLTRNKDLDPDLLAMAGWIAPSGANRSGWLNMARARAGESKDVRTLGFVDRRLVAEHVSAHMSDWAMAAFRGAKLDT